MQKNLVQILLILCYSIFSWDKNFHCIAVCAYDEVLILGANYWNMMAVWIDSIIASILKHSTNMKCSHKSF